jgi:hypothetical protein
MKTLQLFIKINENPSISSKNPPNVSKYKPFNCVSKHFKCFKINGNLSIFLKNLTNVFKETKTKQFFNKPFKCLAKNQNHTKD